MSDISKNIMKKIEEKHIKPIPKWQFALLHVGLFIMFGFAILFGSLAFGVMLLHLSTTDWEIVPRLAGGIHSFIFVLPYMWIIVMGLMVFLATLVYKNTHKGYRMSPSIVLAVSIIASLLFGSILFATKSAQWVENSLRDNFRPYEQYQELREKVWLAPDKGVLPGKIVGIEDDSLWLLDDFSGQKWEVDIEAAKLPPLAPKPQIGDLVVITGEKTDKDSFTADAVRPAPDFKKGIYRGMKKMK